MIVHQEKVKKSGLTHMLWPLEQEPGAKQDGEVYKKSQIYNI